MPNGKKHKRHKMSTHKRKKRLRKNRHKHNKELLTFGDCVKKTNQVLHCRGLFSCYWV